MTETCEREFDQELLTGYLDGELTQADRQRVRLHMEGCAHCTTLFSDLREVSQAARGTAFLTPSDEQWRESARTATGRGLRGTGWLVLSAWAVGMAALTLYQIASSGEPLWEKIAIFGGLSGVGLLFLSVLMDRLHDLKTDPYRRVQK